MNKDFNKFFSYYLSILLLFGIFFLYEKHTVGNDSTISEWIINYQGGFTKRGIIGQLSIYITNFFKLDLRDVILIFQIFILTVYFISLYFFFKDIKINKIIILSIFTPIFILYPIAEIEVLARKELFIFCSFLLYLSLNNRFKKNLYKLTLLPLIILIWEPAIFFFSFWLAVDILEKKIKKIDVKFFKILFSFVPALLVATIIALNPISAENHQIMVNFLKINFNENCYMSCAMLLSKASIYQQFYANFDSYSPIVFLRYTLIIILGFSPLFILNRYSLLNKNDFLFFKNFNNMLLPSIIILSPAITLFAMGSDWGRWVNICYFFSIIFYFYLYKKKIIKLEEKILQNKFLLLFFKKNFFIVVFIIFCFGWNPKTSITGDVATKPGYQIPRKAIKIIYYKYIKD